MAISPDEFKKALQAWASGVAVVTSKSEQLGLRGMTVTSFASVSLEPPQILVCLNQTADTGENIDQNQLFAVNILSTEQQDDSNNFSGGGSQEARFANASWQAGAYGLPLLTDSIMSMECRVVEKVKAGSHFIVVAEVLATQVRDGDPLLYFRGAYRQLADQ
jgi:flavin reductase (DIM6/NTAB) family NADH-FMN oxidoreductase RutF